MNTDRSDTSKPDFKVVHGLFHFANNEAFLGEGLGGMKGMCIQRSHKSPIAIESGFNAVSFAVYQNAGMIYANALIDPAYLSDVLAALQRQLAWVKKDKTNGDFPAKINAMRINAILEFSWTISKGVPNLRSFYGYGLRDLEGQLSEGAVVFNHRDDPVANTGFNLVELDIHPRDRFLFARPSRNVRLIQMAIKNLEAQLERATQYAAMQQPKRAAGS